MSDKPFDPVLEKGFMRESVRTARTFAWQAYKELEELATARPEDPDCKNLSALGLLFWELVNIKFDFENMEHREEYEHGKHERKYLNTMTGNTIPKFLESIKPHKTEYNKGRNKRLGLS